MGELHVADVRAQVALSLFHDFDGGGSEFNPGPNQEEMLTRVLDQVVSWAEALAPLHSTTG